LQCQKQVSIFFSIHLLPTCAAAKLDIAALHWPFGNDTGKIVQFMEILIMILNTICSKDTYHQSKCSTTFDISCSLNDIMNLQILLFLLFVLQLKSSHQQQDQPPLKEKCLDPKIKEQNNCGGAKKQNPCFCSISACSEYSLEWLKKSCKSGFVHSNRCGSCLRCD
jgi:hypothetical protein